MIDRCKFLHNLPCEQVSDRIVELETENENLLKTVDSVMPSLIEDNAKLKVENERLRELVRIMHSELVSCEDNGYVCGGHKFDDRVRELGIEADNDD